MANNMVGCRAGAGTDINPFAPVHDLDFRDRSWGEAAPQQVVWLWVPSHPLSAALAAAARLSWWRGEQRSPALLSCGSCRSQGQTLRGAQ